MPSSILIAAGGEVRAVGFAAGPGLKVVARRAPETAVGHLGRHLVWKGCLNDQECQGIWPGACVLSGGIGWCTQTCVTNGNCGDSTPGNAYSWERYSCTDGLCDYNGCTTDQQCANTAGGESVCRPWGSTNLNYCTAPCTTPVDCVNYYGTQHSFECVAGGCVYRGCASDNACNRFDPPPTYVCEVPARL